MTRLQKLMLASAIISLSGAAFADEPAPVDDPASKSIEKSIAAADDEMLLDLGAFEAGGTLSDEELGAHRAREDIEVDQITINDQDQNGDVTDNVAIGNTNGDNLIDGEAFSNSSGFLSTVQNSGNNVLIQNSTIINVSVDAPSGD